MSLRNVNDLFTKIWQITTNISQQLTCKQFKIHFNKLVSNFSGTGDSLVNIVTTLNAKKTTNPATLR
jgi:hypothetical protein